MKPPINLLNCFLLLFALFISACTNANHGPDDEFMQTDDTTEVTIDEAEAELIGILNEIDAQKTRSGETPNNRRIANRFSTGSYEALTRAEEDEREPYVHIFNFENDEGYAIMSGDERVTPLLALTENGALSQFEVVDNPGLITFLANAEEYYMNEIARVDSLKVSGDIVEAKYSLWKTRYYAMKYDHCKVQWGQDFPYDAYTPSNYYTGCVTTAVAQLMSIYRHPTKYGAYTFDWDEMLKHTRSTGLPKDDTLHPVAHDQIARLMQQLGIKKNLDVDYGSKSSPAAPSNIPRTFENFGYSNGGSLKDYSTSGIVNELSHGYHCLIRGNSHRTHQSILFGLITWYEYSNGHTWLAHGLLERYRTVTTVSADGVTTTTTETLWYPLCNMGWDSNDDGYYLSGVFDTVAGPEYPHTRTEGTDYNYQYNVEMIVGIRK